MANNRLATLCLLLLLPLSYAKFSFGPCPKPAKVQNFDVARFMGDWFEYARTEGTPYQDGECDKAHYVLNGSKVEVTNTQVQKDGKIDVANGDLYCVGTEAQCYVRFSTKAPYGDYQVIDTDYENYTVIYSCTEIAKITHIEYGWILTRSLDFNAEEKADFLVSASTMSKSDLHITRQTECPALNIHGV